MKEPIKGYVNKAYPIGNISQFFGENVELYRERIGTNGHNGIDIIAPWGTPIYAVAGGKVVEVKNDPEGFGKHVRILGEQYEWTYGHASENLVKVGDMVEEGQLIQKMGNTGFVISGNTVFWKLAPGNKGTHLHIGMRKYIKWNKLGDKYNNQYSSGDRVQIENYDNGFKGAVDPRKFLDIPVPPPIVVVPPPIPEAQLRPIQLNLISIANQIISIIKVMIGKK